MTAHDALQEDAPVYSGGRPRRFVVTPGGQADAFDFDVNSVPSEWRHWLAGARQDPPSVQELEGLERDRAQLQSRVAALEAEEVKERLSLGQDPAFEKSVLVAAAQGHATPVGATANGGTKQQQRPSPSPSPSSSPLAPPPPPPLPPGTPPSNSSEPTGQGETFQVGTWTPGGAQKR
jgi:NADH:ubiquinone oxidoreductase subunit